MSSTDNEGTTVIGHICYKGNHISLDGEADYGCCSSHYYAEIRVEVVELYPNPRNKKPPTSRQVATEIALVVKRAEING